MEVQSQRKSKILQPISVYSRDNNKIPPKRKGRNPSKKKAKNDRQMTIPVTNEKDVKLMLCADKAPETYWQAIANETKLALSEALDENEQLHKLTDELKEENVSLRSLVEYYSLMYHTCIDSKH